MRMSSLITKVTLFSELLIHLRSLLRSTPFPHKGRLFCAVHSAQDVVLTMIVRFRRQQATALQMREDCPSTVGATIGRPFGCAIGLVADRVWVHVVSLPL